MSDFLEKLSSYNIFNYLFPGALFVAISGHLSSREFSQDDLLVDIFTYYFIGLVISRVGSLLVEPLLKKIGFLTFSEYSSYLSARKIDETLDELSEANNVYRTLCTLFIFLIALVVFDKLADLYPILEIGAPYAVVFCLLILFLFSYRKQTNYIARRVEASKDK